RRWSLVFIILGMTLVSLLMRRNVCAGALTVIPASLGGLVHPTGGTRDGHTAPAGWRGPTAALVIAAAAILFCCGIVTSRFYKEEGVPIRFGIGLSKSGVALASTAWLDANLPGKRVWCDFGNSSNLHFFTHPHREVPILSNTWAYPPEVMAENRLLRLGGRPF